MLENELSSTIEIHNEKSNDIETKMKAVEDELKQLYEERKVLTEKLNYTQDEHNKVKFLISNGACYFSCMHISRNNNE